MGKIIFLIGHPGAGKTALYLKVADQFHRLGMTTFRVSDRDFFWKAMEMDREQKYHWYREDGTHAITDPRFFVLQTRLLKEHLLNTGWHEDWIFVELTSNDYPKMLAELGADLVAGSGLVLLLASQANALLRNSRRPAASERTDEGRVPEHYILSCFNQPFDLLQLPAFFRAALVIENDSNDLEDLDRLANQVVKFLIDFSEM